jgi:hypothetical protein
MYTPWGWSTTTKIYCVWYNRLFDLQIYSIQTLLVYIAESTFCVTPLKSIKLIVSISYHISTARGGVTITSRPAFARCCVRISSETSTVMTDFRAFPQFLRENARIIHGSGHNSFASKSVSVYWSSLNLQLDATWSCYCNGLLAHSTVCSGAWILTLPMKGAAHPPESL